MQVMLDLFTRCIFYWISILVMHSIDSLILMPFRRFKIQKQIKWEKNSKNIEQKMYFSSSSLNFLSICLHSCLIAGNSGGFFFFFSFRSVLWIIVYFARYFSATHWFVSVVRPFMLCCLSSVLCLFAFPMPRPNTVQAVKLEFLLFPFDSR